MVVEHTSLDLAREEANIQRKKSTAILQSELGRQSEKAGHLDRMLRDSVSKQAIADALVVEREVSHLKEKQNLKDQVRELKKKMRESELKLAEHEMSADEEIHGLKRELSKRSTSDGTASALEEQVQLLESALEEEKKRTLREQEKHAATLVKMKHVGRSNDDNDDDDAAAAAAAAAGSSSSSSSSSSGQQQRRLLVQVSELERKNRALLRETVEMRKKTTKAIVLQEKVDELELRALVEQKKLRETNVVLSERNMLVEEKREQSEQFMEVLARCRSMNGDTELNDEAKMKLEHFTVPAVVSFFFFEFFLLSFFERFDTLVNVFCSFSHARSFYLSSLLSLLSLLFVSPVCLYVLCCSSPFLFFLSLFFLQTTKTIFFLLFFLFSSTC